MYAPAGVKTSKDYPIPDTMKAWVLGDPGQLSLKEKPVPVPKKAEVLVRIDAVAICATDLEIIYHGPPASIQGGFAFNKNFTPGHEYMGTVVALGPGVDEYKIGQRITVEIHAGCGQCKRCREGMYTACHNYGLNYGDVDKGHRANGFTTDGGFCEYQVNNINTLVAIPDDMSDEEATLVVTAGTAMYGLTELGGLVAGESVVVTGPGPIGLLGVAVAKAMGAHPVILTGTRDNRLKIGLELGADHVLNARKEKDIVAAVKELNGGRGVDYVVECSGAPNAVTEAVRMVNRGGKVCLAAFPHEDTMVDVAHIVRNNIYLYGIRGEGKSATHRAEAFMRQKRFDATKIHTHTFPLDDLPTAIRYAKDRVEDAIKVVVKARGVSAAHKVAAE
jgi:threonine dehydrogenase-like Zn-dependent dehydrogenase